VYTRRRHLSKEVTLKKYLVATLAILVLVGAGMAKEIAIEVGSVPDAGLTVQYEPVSPMPGAARYLPPPPSEVEFLYDNDSTSTYCPWASYQIRIGKQFDGNDFGVPECYITGWRIYYYLPSGSGSCHASFYDDEGGWPDEGTLLWESDFTASTTGWSWYDLEVDPPVYDADANFFGVFAWNSTGESGGPGVDTSGDMSHDYQYYGSWAAGWYRYYLRAYANDDVDPPYGDNYDPDDGDTDVPIDTNIYFDIIDDDYGTDGDTIVVEVDGVDVTGDCDITDNGDGSFSVEYDPDTDFDYETSVEVYWSAADGLGNLGEDTWTFDTEEEPPNVVSSTWGQIKADF
jgi:hypothetical protein